MAFIWQDTPSSPPVPLPVPVGADKITFKVHEVANTVNAGGQVSYNTPNTAFDVVYEFDSLNVRNMRIGSGTFEDANIRSLIINTAKITQAVINTANITHATINVGFFTGNATDNFSMVSKAYVDNAIASISGGTGPDGTANLIITKGDLLVGFSPNTAHRLPPGTEGQVLSVYGSSNVGMQWENSAASQVIEGLDIGTHWHPSLKSTQVLLRRADGIVMDDGEFVTGWDGLIADMTITGAGGRDSVSASATNTWYEVWAIRNSSSGAKALLLHRMLDRSIDQFYDGLVGGTLAILGQGAADTTLALQRQLSRVSQSIVASKTGIMRAVQFRVRPVGGPTDIRSSRANTWVTLEQPDDTGNSTGSIFATSRLVSTRDFGSDEFDCHFVFDTNFTVTSGNKYIFVIRQDWVINVGFSSLTHANTLGMILSGNTGAQGPGQQPWMANVGYNGGGTYVPYANVGFGDCRGFNVATGRWSTMANLGGPSDLHFRTFIETNETPVSLPSGYNQKVLVSFVHNDGSGKLKEYRQKDRTLMMGTEPSWEIHPHNLTFFAAALGMFYVNLSNFVPPIPCVVQFLAVPLVGNPVTFGMHFGTITAFDVSLQFRNNYNSGVYSFGPGGSVGGGMLNRMPLDGLQAILFYDGVTPLVTAQLFPLSLTF